MMIMTTITTITTDDVDVDDDDDGDDDDGDDDDWSDDAVYTFDNALCAVYLGIDYEHDALILVYSSVYTCTSRRQITCGHWHNIWR